MHRRGSLVTEDEKNRVIHAGHFSSMGGDFTIAIQVIPDKNKRAKKAAVFMWQLREAVPLLREN